LYRFPLWTYSYLHAFTGVARLKKPKETRRLASAARNLHAFTGAAQLKAFNRLVENFGLNPARM